MRKFDDVLGLSNQIRLSQIIIEESKAVNDVERFEISSERKSALIEMRSRLIRAHVDKLMDAASEELGKSAQAGDFTQCELLNEYLEYLQRQKNAIL